MADAGGDDVAAVGVGVVGRGAPGTIPITSPPASAAAREAASITPPPPPQTTATPASASPRPTSSASVQVSDPSSIPLPPITAI